MKFLPKLLLAIFLISCAKVPISNRRQLHLLPESTLMSMSLTNYRQFLSQNQAVASSNQNTQLVKRVGGKIQNAVVKYMHDEGLSKRIKDYKWEFNLVQDDLVNAWCMPGGKVVIYTGILPVTQDETGLAVVMGHEIAHAIARHGNERMSQQLAAVAGGVGLAVALNEKPEQTKNIFLAAYGATTGLGILKYSRMHESEADKLGLVFMAQAGYDPDKAVGFWERMAKQGGANVPEFLSTHPSHETRIQKIKEFLPEARRYYQAAIKGS
ncbi:MAG: M48 family metallopeptidase [Flavobacteriales bacterium]|nr:M48 family metallopeptidase [Flavobacteriales bacterium]